MVRIHGFKAEVGMRTFAGVCSSPLVRALLEESVCMRACPYFDGRKVWTISLALLAG